MLLANNGTDYSYEVALRYQQQFPDFPLHIAQIHLPAAKANIGTVRRLLMDEAHRRLTSLSRSDGIIASTDGDTVVDTPGGDSSAQYSPVAKIPGGPGVGRDATAQAPMWAKELVKGYE